MLFHIFFVLVSEQNGFILNPCLENQKLRGNIKSNCFIQKRTVRSFRVMLKIT